MAASGGAEDHDISDYDSDTEPLIGATSGATSLQKTISSSSTIDLFGSDSDTPPEGGGQMEGGGRKEGGGRMEGHSGKPSLAKRESTAHDISESDTDSDKTIDPNQVSS